MFFRAHYGVGTPFLEAPEQNWYLNAPDLKVQGQLEAEVWFLTSQHSCSPESILEPLEGA